jgi:hypothetical protein
MIWLINRGSWLVNLRQVCYLLYWQDGLFTDHSQVSAVRNNMALYSCTVELKLGRSHLGDDRSLGMVYRNETRSVINSHRQTARTMVIARIYTVTY